MSGDERLLWDSLNLLRSPMSGDERLLWDSLNLLRSPMSGDERLLCPKSAKVPYDR